jgi:hypothetical protein
MDIGILAANGKMGDAKKKNCNTNSGHANHVTTCALEYGGLRPFFLRGAKRLGNGAVEDAGGGMMLCVNNNNKKKNGDYVTRVKKNEKKHKRLFVLLASATVFLPQPSPVCQSIWNTMGYSCTFKRDNVIAASPFLLDLHSSLRR